MTALVSDTSSSVNARLWDASLSGYLYRKAEGLFEPEAVIFGKLDAEIRKGALFDIGIGTGRTTAYLAPRAASYIGCDYSRGMLERALPRFPGTDLRHIDARDLSLFAPASFDIVVFSYNGIDYVDHADRLSILGEIRRVLKPGGAFVFSSHNRLNPVRKPWDLHNMELSAHPARLARGVLRYGLGIWNGLRMQRRETHEPHFAILNDSERFYGMLTYYIHARDQVRQLEDAGFTGVECYGLNGQKIAPAQSRAQDNMVYYMARRA